MPDSAIKTACAALVAKLEASTLATGLAASWALVEPVLLESLEQEAAANAKTQVVIVPQTTQKHQRACVTRVDRVMVVAWVLQRVAAIDAESVEPTLLAAQNIADELESLNTSTARTVSRDEQMRPVIEVEELSQAGVAKIGIPLVVEVTR